MDWIEILVTAFAAFVGAVIGFVSSLLLQKQQQKHDIELQFRRDQLSLYQQFTNSVNQFVATGRCQKYDKVAAQAILDSFGGLQFCTSDELLEQLIKIHAKVGDIMSEGAVSDQNVDLIDKLIRNFQVDARKELKVTRKK